jgi:hypothetical protein
MERRGWAACLKTFFGRWVRRSPDSSLPASLAAEITPEEEISSYVRYDRLLDRRNGTVKHEHFLPREVLGRYESSVYRTSGLSQAENWALVRLVFEGNGKNVAKARAFGPANAILCAGLAFDADGKPHPRHANIIGWSQADKHMRKQQAMNFASSFRYEERPATAPLPTVRTL